MDAAEEEEIVAARGIEGEIVEDDAVVDRRGIAQVRGAVGIADRDVMDAVLIGTEGGMIRSDEKPWIVVMTGVSTSRDQPSAMKSAWLWRMSNSPARSKTWAMCSISQTLASMVGSSE